MSVANLTRYGLDRDYDCGQSCGLDLCEYSDGMWVKFEEAVEASSNSLQQLKAEIAALVREYSSSAAFSSQAYLGLINKLRQLSAI
jgi:hypothetical protein